ncbi:MAG: OmpH family outer membrane protein [Cyclobacteriaceae bacterium]|jgi:outer membrane protein|nr:OmpH family outer membrane protein [Flammeovirgaceae bacterium]MCZ8021081.1 OmpH family outer membrane protein [Cytophagales bacterium]MCZ8328564.1 OmpH family outer membrane protein [Cyclobacteriaceae bacterium]
MKIATTFAFVLITATCFSQRFGYIDTDYILKKMPEFKKADDEINQLSQAWEAEVREMSKIIDGMLANLKAEQVLLTDDMKRERELAIQKKENELKEYQKKLFGVEGLYFLKKQELIKPILDKIWDATDKVAKQNNLAIVFDKAGQLVMIYTDPRYDYTEFVLEALGLGDPNDTVKN